MLAHLKALHALLEAIPADNSALQKTVCNVLRTGLRAYIESVDPKALVAPKESKVRGALHGTPYRYSKGCRCDDCKAAIRERNQRYYLAKKAKREIAPSDPEPAPAPVQEPTPALVLAKIRSKRRTWTHGIGAYQGGCRCEVCKAAKSEENRKRREKMVHAMQ